VRAEYRVLGPLEVLLDGGPVAVPGGRCHVLLATLLLRPNRFVSVDELVDRLWDGRPPRSTVHTRRRRWSCGGCGWRWGTPTACARLLAATWPRWTRTSST
jgi:hypothetical protein